MCVERDDVVLCEVWHKTRLLTTATLLMLKIIFSIHKHHIISYIHCIFQKGSKTYLTLPIDFCQGAWPRPSIGDGHSWVCRPVGWPSFVAPTWGRHCITDNSYTLENNGNKGKKSIRSLVLSQQINKKASINSHLWHKSIEIKIIFQAVITFHFLRSIATGWLWTESQNSQ